MNSKTNNGNCLRLTYAAPGNPSPTRLLGRISAETPDYIVFQTARREYTISRFLILAVEPTIIPFRKEGEE